MYFILLIIIVETNSNMYDAKWTSFKFKKA